MSEFKYWKVRKSNKVYRVTEDYQAWVEVLDGGAWVEVDHDLCDFGEDLLEVPLSEVNKEIAKQIKEKD